MKKILFNYSKNIIDNLNKYFIYLLFCINHNYNYDLSNETQENEYIFYEGLDYFNNDIEYVDNHDIDFIKNYIKNIPDIVAFNTLGFLKDKINIKDLKESEYINKKNNHGIYVKNIIEINNKNILFYLDNNNEKIFNFYLNKNIKLIKNIYIKNKDKILHFLELNKNNDTFIKDILSKNNIKYNIILYLDIKIDIKNIEELLNKLFSINNINEINCLVIIDNIKLNLNLTNKYLINILKLFENKNIKAEIKINYDISFKTLNIMKSCDTLISTNKDLGFFCHFLSENIKNYYYLSSKIKSVIIKIDNYRDNITNQLKIDMNLLNIETEIFNGINGKNIKIYDTEDNNIKLLYHLFETYYYDITKRFNKKIMSKGELGCAWSHLTIYKKLLEDNVYDKYLILEDDAEKVVSLEELSLFLNNIPEDADLCHIAKSDSFAFIKKFKINDFYYDIHHQFFNRTTAYIITKSGARKLLNYYENFINLPSDDLIYNCSKNNFNLYVPKNYLFEEDSNNDSIIKNYIE